MRIFIGSSEECYSHIGKDGLNLKALLQSLLPEAEVTYWKETSLWENLDSPLGSIKRFVTTFDYAILVGFPDDLVQSRNQVTYQTRDNVILELGIFVEQLGTKRTFFLEPALQQSPDKTPFKRPSDLGGTTIVPYKMNMNNTTRHASWEMALGESLEGIAERISSAENEITKRKQPEIRAEIDSLVGSLAKANKGGQKARSLAKSLPTLIELKARWLGDEGVSSVTADSQNLNNVVEDICSYFQEVPDIVSVNQLISQQQQNHIHSVWVYASQALEFVSEGNDHAYLHKTLEMVARNIERGVSYTYFLESNGSQLSSEQIVSRIRRCAKGLNFDMKKFESSLRENLTVVFMPSNRFLTNFTLHFNEEKMPISVYMSAINPSRHREIAYKLHDGQAIKVFTSIRSFFSHNASGPVPTYEVN